MSAKNWRACPACQEKLTAAWEEQKRELVSTYAHSTRPHYDKLLRECPKRCPEVDHTFREDYEIGVNLQGEFSVDYHGQCTECEFTRSFSYPSGIVRVDPWLEKIEKRLVELYLQVVPGTAVIDAMDRITIISAKFRDLQAIINMLPKTEDGVPIIPGITIYGFGPVGSISTLVVDCWTHVAISIGNRWWSTRELAEKARDRCNSS